MRRITADVSFAAALATMAVMPSPAAAPLPELVVNFAKVNPSLLPLHDGTIKFTGPIDNKATNYAKARPATRAVAGLLNGGPEFGAKFLDPLRMANYRGAACQSPSAYAAAAVTTATCGQNREKHGGQEETRRVDHRLYLLAHEHKNTINLGSSSNFA